MIGIRERRAVLDELARLDPETDDQRITALCMGRVFGDPFFLGALFAEAFWRQAASPPIAKIMYRANRGDTMTQPAKRVADSLVMLGIVYRHGWQSEIGAKTLDRVAAIHERFGIREDEMRYTLGSLMFEPVRLTEQFGITALTPAEARASYVFWKHVGEQWSLTVEDEETFRAWWTEYERTTYRHTDEGAAVARAIADEFAARWFPRPLRFLGHQLLRAVADDHLLKSVDMPRATLPSRVAVRVLLWSYTRGRRILPRRTDGLVSPWNKAYGGGEPDPLTVGPDWAKGLVREGDWKARREAETPTA